MAAAASRVGLRCLRLHRRSRASLQVHDRRDGDLGASQLSLGHAQELGLAPNVGRPQRTHGVLQYLARRLERVREETRQARRHPRIRVCVGCRRRSPILGLPALIGQQHHVALQLAEADPVLAKQILVAQPGVDRLNCDELVLEFREHHLSLLHRWQAVQDALH
jgi:hypothetical protein